ncbi:putative non-LTR retroelement reverse transcriptase [Cucumis melo var. makuwa]|uniref:Non-LTR retroelement reverse transcriptase n=1 Tax=Cucumis melo var. makuwa TaxID=1194695 RepID=A0A5A7UHR4_CUCMM|nr:putative non-LTR retroelement reverse transcriptase [Cucumis melo var. makuwa]TYJ98277.1 putative non-LTR retroelement reverse transcriptase [Cucumis melo var. makuwa]
MVGNFLTGPHKIPLDDLILHIVPYQNKLQSSPPSKTCYLPQRVNAIAITLIPKRCGAGSMEDGNQFAFIPRRSIINNILLYLELVEGYHLNSGPVLHFSLFSIMINSSLEGFFHGRKGLRVSNEVASRLATSLGIALGNLPTRYLRLSLLFGRLQLIRYMLRSLQVYWARRKVETPVKVAWAEVCLPSEEGGLIILDGPSWNIASTMKILWLMLTSLGSLWVAWVEAYILKERLLWMIESGEGPILEQVGERVLDDTTSQREARLSEFIESDGKCVRDIWVWVPGHQGGFSISSLWDTVRTRYGQVLQVMAFSHRIRYWGVELSWICRQGIRKSVRRKLCHILWYTTIYFIWKEWNHRFHGGQARDPIVLFQLICTCIRTRAISWREDAQILI